MIKPIYPKIEASVTVWPHNEYRIKYVTNVRKKHRGKYYLVLVILDTAVSKYALSNAQEASKTLEEFLARVHQVMLLHKINPKLKHLSGNLVYVPDTDQTSEEDRMRNYFNP